MSCCLLFHSERNIFNLLPLISFIDWSHRPQLEIRLNQNPSCASCIILNKSLVLVVLLSRSEEWDIVDISSQRSITFLATIRFSNNTNNCASFVDETLVNCPVSSWELNLYFHCVDSQLLISQCAHLHPWIIEKLVLQMVGLKIVHTVCFLCSTGWNVRVTGSISTRLMTNCLS